MLPAVALFSFFSFAMIIPPMLCFPSAANLQSIQQGEAVGNVENGTDCYNVGKNISVCISCGNMEKKSNCYNAGQGTTVCIISCDNEDQGNGQGEGEGDQGNGQGEGEGGGQVCGTETCKLGQQCVNIGDQQLCQGPVEGGGDENGDEEGNGEAGESGGNSSDGDGSQEDGGHVIRIRRTRRQIVQPPQQPPPQQQQQQQQTCLCPMPGYSCLLGPGMVSYCVPSQRLCAGRICDPCQVCAPAVPSANNNGNNPAAAFQCMPAASTQQIPPVQLPPAFCIQPCQPPQQCQPVPGAVAGSFGQCCPPGGCQQG